jgi:plasmid maintenance system antidote protein VapI
MRTEGLSNSKFASILGIQRSNITHIIDGRNKPSLSFLEKLITKFPNVNIEWLMTGTGEMYKKKDIAEQKFVKKKDVSPTLFSEHNSKQTVEPELELKLELEPEHVEPKLTTTQKTKKETATNKSVKMEFPAPQVTETVQKTNIRTENPEQQMPSKPDVTDKITEQEIECVLIFRSDKTFKYYKPV